MRGLLAQIGLDFLVILLVAMLITGMMMLVTGCGHGKLACPTQRIIGTDQGPSGRSSCTPQPPR